MNMHTRESSEPDGHALLARELIALILGHALVPGDVGRSTDGHLFTAMTNRATVQPRSSWVSNIVHGALFKARLGSYGADSSSEAASSDLRLVESIAGEAMAEAESRRRRKEVVGSGLQVQAARAMEISPYS